MRDRLRRTVERHPLLWVALVAAAMVLAADGQWLAGLLVAGLLLLLITLSGLRRIALAALCFALLAGLLHAWRTTEQDGVLGRLARDKVRSATIAARVISEPRANERGWSGLVEVLDGGPAGKVWAYGEGALPLRWETVELKGRFLPLPVRRNPGTFDVQEWLYRQGAYGSFDSQQPARSLAPPTRFRMLENEARTGFRHAVTTGLDPASREAAVIRAMVLGDTPANDEELIDAYRASGTLHAFSVSGMHVAMVGLIGWFVLKGIGVPRRSAVVLLMAGMLAYAWITGMKPPAVRSVIMAGALLGAFLVRRRPDLLNSLGFALLATVITDGHLIFQAGVQLSFGVVWAIGIGTAVAAPLFAWIEKREPYLPRQLYGKFREFWLRRREATAAALAASTAASIGSVPLTLWHFGFLAPISILASPIVGVIILVLMAVALLAAALSPISQPAAQFFNRTNGYVAHSCTATAAFFAKVPGGNYNVPRERPGEDFLVIYDPGYGGGAALLHDHGVTVLIDAASKAGYRSILAPSMKRMGLAPDSIALSHPDGGHIGGAVEALAGGPLRQILIPVQRARSSVFKDLLKEGETRHVPLVVGALGARYPVAQDSWLEVLDQPPPDDTGISADERVMVMRLHWRGWRILFTSDAGWTTERRLIDSRQDLGADLIVAGRNTKDSSLGDDFLAAVKPKAIIASHDDFPPDERIPPRWAEHCENKLGIHLFHQGKTGAVTAVLEKDGALVLRGFVDGSEMRLEPK